MSVDDVSESLTAANQSTSLISAPFRALLLRPCFLVIVSHRPSTTWRSRGIFESQNADSARHQTTSGQHPSFPTNTPRTPSILYLRRRTVRQLSLPVHEVSQALCWREAIRTPRTSSRLPAWLITRNRNFPASL